LTGKAARLKELRPMTSKQIAAKEAARAQKVKSSTVVNETPITSSNESSNE